MKFNYIRWALFFLIGLPTQLIIYLVYPILVIVFNLKYKNKHPEIVRMNVRDFPIINKSLEWMENWPRVAGMNLSQSGNFANHGDDHGALIHYGTFYYLPKHRQLAAMDDLVAADGSLKRTENGIWGTQLSRDVLGAWIFAARQFGVNDGTLKKVVKHFLLNCFGFLDRGIISNRNSCSGLNYCEDGQYKLGLPCFGPQFYAASGLLYLAHSRFGGIYTLIYVLHWILMGGWLWWVEPVIYTHDHNVIYYEHHVTAMSINSLKGQPFIAAAARNLFSARPNKNYEGIVGSILADADGLTKKEIQEIGECLIRIQKFWPQALMKNAVYFESRIEDNMFMNMGFHAYLTLKALDKCKNT